MRMWMIRQWRLRARSVPLQLEMSRPVLKPVPQRNWREFAHRVRSGETVTIAVMQLRFVSEEMEKAFQVLESRLLHEIQQLRMMMSNALHPQSMGFSQPPVQPFNGNFVQPPIPPPPTVYSNYAPRPMKTHPEPSFVLKNSPVDDSFKKALMPFPPIAPIVSSSTIKTTFKTTTARSSSVEKSTTTERVLEFRPVQKKALITAKKTKYPK